MSNIQKLKVSKNTEFINRVVEEFREKDPVNDGPNQINNLKYLSLIPSGISLFTAGFLVYYFVSDYDLISSLFLGFIMIAVLVGNEIAKRELLSRNFKSFYLAGKVGFAMIIGLLIVHAISMSSSYVGGNKIVTENSVSPTLPANPQIAELESRLSSINESIKKQQSTTWKGVITVDANRNLKRLFPTQQSILNQITELENVDRQNQIKSDQKHNAKITNLGFLTGSVALICDLVLFFMLLSIARLKNDIRLSINSPTPPPARQRKTPPARNHRPFLQSEPGQGGERYVNSVNNTLNEPEINESTIDIREILSLAKKRAKGDQLSYEKRNTDHARQKAAHLKDLEMQLGEILKASA